MSQPIGEYLARQRRLRSISLDELAATTRIPRRSLERLEGGAFDRERDGFVRGFVRTVAAALGLDPADTLNRMLTEPSGGERGSRSQKGTLVTALFAAGTLLALLSLLWVTVPPGPSEPSPGVAAEAPAPGLVYRRDAVRRLAESSGAFALGLGSTLEPIGLGDSPAPAQP